MERSSNSTYFIVDTDQQLSNTEGGKLAYTIPAITDFHPDWTLRDFEGVSSLNTYIDVVDG